MKWIACTRSENIDPSVATQLLHSLQHDEPPSLSSDPSTALAAASKYFLSVVKQRATGRSQADALFLGPNSAGALLLPTCPVRLDLQALLDAIRVDGALAERVVSLSICVFAGPNIGEDGRHIVAQLAETAGVDDTLSRPASGGGPEDGAVGFDKFLRLNFGEKRRLGDAVEIRSVVEYDAIVDALFSSRTFQQIIRTVSVKVEVKSSARTYVREEADDAPYWYASARHTFWFLNKTHARQFPQLAMASQKPSMAQPLLVFQFFSQIPEVVASSDVIDELNRTSASLAQLRSNGQTILRAGEDAASPTSTRIRKNVTLLEQQQHQNESTINQTTIPGLNSSGDMTASGAAVSSRRQGASLADELIDEFSKLEPKFNGAVQLHRDECSAKKATEAELEAWGRKLETLHTEREALDQTKTSLADEVNNLSVSKKTLEQRIAAAQESRMRLSKGLAAEMAMQREDADRERQDMLRDVTERSRSLVEAADEQASRELAQKQAVARQRRDAVEALRLSMQNTLAAVEQARQRASDRFEIAALAGSKSAATVTAHQQSLSEAQRAVGHIGSLGWNEGSIAAERRVAEYELSRIATSIEELRTERSRLSGERQRLEQHIPALQDKLRSRAEGSLDELVDLRLRVAARNKTCVFDVERLEGLRRDTLRLMEASSREHLLTFEAQHWHTALRNTELAFVSEGQTKIRDEIFGTEHDCETLRLTVAELKGKLDELNRAVAGTTAEHAELLNDTRTHLATIQREEISMLEYDSKQEHFSFPELDEEAAKLQSLVERLRVCMTCGAVGTPPSVAAGASDGGSTSRIPHREPASVPLAGRAKAAGRVVPDARLVRERLRRLVDDGKGQEEAWLMARDTSLLKCDREEREHDERQAVLSQSTLHLDALKRHIEQCAQNNKSKSDELDVRRSRHNQLLAKLQEEQRYAEVVAARHRDEVDAHLRALRDKNEEVHADIEQNRREIRKLELQAETARLQNSAAHAETLKLQVLRERDRSAELRAQLILLPPR